MRIPTRSQSNRSNEDMGSGHRKLYKRSQWEGLKISLPLKPNATRADTALASSQVFKERVANTCQKRPGNLTRNTDR